MDEITRALGSSTPAVVAVLIVLIAAVGVTVITAICVLSAMWRSVRVREEENDLKREMLARGMSAEDIVRVLTASADPETIRQQRIANRNGRIFSAMGIPTQHN